MIGGLVSMVCPRLPLSHIPSGHCCRGRQGVVALLRTLSETPESVTASTQ